MLFQFLSLLTLIASPYLNPSPPAALASSHLNPPVLGVAKAAAQTGPTRNPNMLGVKLTAKAAVVLDKESGKILFAKNMDLRLPEASLTKVMTAIVVLDNKPKLGDIVTVSAGPLKVQPWGADLALKEGEKISVYNLLRSLLIISANDAAVALAEYTANQEERFVNLMNQKARALKLKNTYFKNTHGLDQEGHYSSAYDLAQMMRYALNKKVFREVIQMPRFTFDTSVRTHWIKNTNKLLDQTYFKIIGGKTGFTDNAGLCLIEAAQNQTGHEIIVVLMNSENEWQEAKGLIDWTFRAYTWPKNNQ